MNHLTPRQVLLDSGAKPVILGKQFARALGIKTTDLDPPPYSLVTALQSVESVYGITKEPVSFHFKPGHPDDAATLAIKVLVGPATNYDVLLGADLLTPQEG